MKVLVVFLALVFASSAAPADIGSGNNRVVPADVPLTSGQVAVIKTCGRISYSESNNAFVFRNFKSTAANVPLLVTVFTGSVEADGQVYSGIKATDQLKSLFAVNVADGRVYIDEEKAKTGAIVEIQQLLGNSRAVGLEDHPTLAGKPMLGVQDIAVTQIIDIRPIAEGLCQPLEH